MNENTSSLQQLLAGLQGPPGGEGGGGVGLLKNNPGREDNVNTSASSSSSSSSSSNNNNNLMINNGQQPGDNANHPRGILLQHMQMQRQSLGLGSSGTGGGFNLDGLNLANLSQFSASLGGGNTGGSFGHSGNGGTVGNSNVGGNFGFGSPAAGGNLCINLGALGQIDDMGNSNNITNNDPIIQNNNENQGGAADEKSRGDGGENSTLNDLNALGLGGINMASLAQQRVGGGGMGAANNNDLNSMGLGNFNIANLSQQFGNSRGNAQGLQNPNINSLAGNLNAAGLGQMGSAIGGDALLQQSQHFGGLDGVGFMNNAKNNNATLATLSNNINLSNNMSSMLANLSANAPGGAAGSSLNQHTESIIAAAMAAAGGNANANVPGFLNAGPNSNGFSLPNGFNLNQQSLDFFRRASMGPGAVGGIQNNGNQAGNQNSLGAQSPGPLQGTNNNHSSMNNDFAAMMQNLQQQQGNSMPSGRPTASLGPGGALGLAGMNNQQNNSTMGPTNTNPFAGMSVTDQEALFANNPGLQSLVQQATTGPSKTQSGFGAGLGGTGAANMANFGLRGAAPGAAGMNPGQFNVGGANINFNNFQQHQSILQQQLQAHQQQMQTQLEQGLGDQQKRRRSSSLSSNGMDGNLNPFDRRRSSLGLGMFTGAGANAGTSSDIQALFSGVPVDDDDGVAGNGKGKKRGRKRKKNHNLTDTDNPKLSPVLMKGKEKKKRAKTFPEKLMEALMAHSEEDAVAWLPDGKSFVVVDPELLCEDVLSNVFKVSKYASFVRKLHRWGFVRLTSGTGTDCFHHPLFQRGKMDQCSKIICTPRAEYQAGNAAIPGMGAVGGKDQARLMGMEGGGKPPSLAGVEKFIRAKVVADAAKQKSTLPATSAAKPNEKSDSVVADPQQKDPIF